MIIIESKIVLESKYFLNANKIEAGFRCTMLIEGRGYICKINPINQSYIPLDEEVYVNIEILYGEIEIQTIKENMEFKFVSGSMIGSGIVIKVKEIYVDLDAMESLGDSISIKRIVQEAERKENAIVDEKIYNLIK